MIKLATFWTLMLGSVNAAQIGNPLGFGTEHM